MTMIGGLCSEKRRHSEYLPHHKSSLPSSHHHDRTIAAIAAEGRSMGVEGACEGRSHQMVPPPRESTKQLSSLGVQIFLCLLGSIMAAGISMWMAVFSKDNFGRRIVVSLVSAICAMIFGLIAYAAFRKHKKKVPVDDVEISQSIIREHRKSMSNSLRKGTANGDEIIRQIRRHSSVIAIDHARQQLLLQQHEAATGAKGMLLVADESPQKQKRASTSD